MRGFLSALFLCLAFFSLTVLQGNASPQDPHLARCYNVPTLPFVPEKYTSQACAWFEGWYARIVDPASGNSFATIVGTVNATGQSMVALLACYSEGNSPPPPVETCSSDGTAGTCSQGANTAGKKEGESKAEAAWQAVGGSACGQLKLTEFIATGATLETHGHGVYQDPSPRASPNFEWSLPGHGFIRVTEGLTTIDLSVGDVSLKANLTNQKGWKKGDPAASPEGWVGKLASFVLPCRWYVYSLGSTATYEFRNGTVVKEGTGFAHEEKNWGKMFPEGHVWAQAISADNSVQFVLAMVYFKVLGISSPYVVSIGYRSPNLQQDFRNVDLLSFVTEMQIEPCAGKINVLAHTLEFSLRIEMSAPLDTFSPKLLAPDGNAEWVPACQESFAAVARIGVWRRNDTWLTRFSERFNNGPMGKNRLIDRYDIYGAALEFGEDLLCEKYALNQLEKQAKAEAKATGRWGVKKTVVQEEVAAEEEKVAAAESVEPVVASSETSEELKQDRSEL